MNSRQPKLLLVLALALFAYIVVYERPETEQDAAATAASLLPGINPAAVSRVEFQSSNTTLVAELRDHKWKLISPVSYSANETSIQSLLESAAELKPRVTVGADTIDQLADFGLEPARGTLTIFQGSTKLELHIGALTPIREQLYVRAADSDAIAVVDSRFDELLPFNSAIWRSTRLLELADDEFDRIRIRNNNSVIVMGRETNDTWRILQPPPPKRADNARIRHLLDFWRQWPVQGFVTDDPNARLVDFGLDKPELELAFSRGTNELMSIQFGNTPETLPKSVYARISQSSNIVVAASHFLNPLRDTYWTYCDHRLFDAIPETNYNLVSVTGPEAFTVRRRTNGLWLSAGTNRTPVDPALMFHFLSQLFTTEAAEIEKEVVTDYTEYGLDKPSISYRLLKTSTNAAGVATNRLIAGVDFGKALTDRAYARRHDENAVYVVPLAKLRQLPSALYEIRSRFLWSFTTNQVAGITVFNDGLTNRLRREVGGQWTREANGKSELFDVIGGAAVEETAVRLGLLQALSWVNRGRAKLPTYGITARSRGLTIELAAPRLGKLTLLFGRMPRGRDYIYTAYFDQDEKDWIVFQFPRKLFEEYVFRHLSPVKR